MESCKRAFTLAEVLITLGVIGIVAALTMPTLITKYQKMQTVNQLKKTYSLLSQAINMSIVQNETPDTWELGDGSAEQTKVFLNKYIFPYLKVVKQCDVDKNSECFTNPYKLNGEDIYASLDDADTTYTTFVLADGTSVATKASFKSGGTDTRKIMSFLVDLNGIKKPNRNGRDVFYFQISFSGYNTLGEGTPLYLKLAPLFSSYDKEDITATNRRCSTDKTGDGEACARLIQLDGWQISDDYPW